MNEQPHLIFNRSMFPAGGAGDFTYNEAKANYGAKYSFFEPRKTMRVTVSTSF